MEKYRKLLMDQEFRTKGRFFRDAVCRVRVFIDEIGGIHEVVLTGPEDKKYRGVSTSNYFEVFATRIKNQFLHDVSANDIHWFNHLKWKSPEYEDQLLKVELEWEDDHYINAEWKGAKALSHDQLHRRLD